MLQRVLPALWISVIFVAGSALAVNAAAQVATPLSEADAARYRAIFQEQEEGDMKTADAIIAKLEDPILMGHVLHQRYMHPTAWRSSYEELSSWLDKYADHPNADVVYALASKRRPRGAIAPDNYQTRRWRTKEEDWLPPALKEDYKNNRNPAEVARIEGYIRYLNADDRPTQALNYIRTPRWRAEFTDAQYDRVLSWIAASYYYNENLAEASRLAREVSARNGDTAVLAYWVAGLTSWRKGEYQAAADYFTRMADVKYQEASFRAAAGFWAARANLATGRHDKVIPYLHIAAQFPFTFYGQLALGQLGQESGVDWSAPRLTEAQWNEISAKSVRVRRAAALAQVGMETLAHTEMRWAHGELEDADDAALMAVAFDTKLWAAQIDMAIASAAHLPDATPFTAAGLYPVPDYAPNDGFKIDRAILFGMIRQESKFKTEALSRVGAAGLMQLMPRTASYVANDSSLMQNGKASDKLYEPGYNMQLGQSYIDQLLTRYTDGDLLEMAIAYNWGPGNLSRWKAANPMTDELLMIESIPNPEARDFVEYVLTNMWVYRARLGQPAPSRDSLAAGGKAIYVPVDTKNARTSQLGSPMGGAGDLVSIN
uniref:Lytic transglycosylase n=1 Tax=Aquisalinus luteolus TaxID=1566827 RepID=A0A8J3A5B7_9PROT|nr:lytic transglycosylase [Aquisalinus luteolus]